MRKMHAQTRPFVTPGFPGMKDTPMRMSIFASRSQVGKRSSTSVSSVSGMEPRSRRKMNRITGTVARAPSSVAQKMEGLPSIKMKSMKSIPA